MAPTRIEPATFRFVAQHLNHCATAVPSNRLGTVKIPKVWHLQIRWVRGNTDFQYKVPIKNIRLEAV